MIDEAKKQKIQFDLQSGKQKCFVSKYCGKKKWKTHNAEHNPDFHNKFDDVVCTWEEYPTH
jgi:hypothetical protein